MLRKVVVLLLISIFALSLAFANDEDLGIVNADVPVIYGDESFRERILDRTNGERDPVGLVLTGGSARALAHIGVLKYLEENGIVPDFIISNSMGSIIALMYAAGISPDDIVDFLVASDLSNLFSFTLPLKGGILLPTGFETLMDSVVGADKRIEDLEIPVMIVCDDLVTKREIRIAEGDFTTVLLASFALPVYFPPVEYNGHLLTDGGTVTLLPLDVAYEYTDTVIVSTTFYNRSDINLLNPITVLNSAFDIGKNQRAASALKEYEGFAWIRCRVEEFSFMDFNKGELLAELGYQSAVESADELVGIYRGGVPEGLNRARETARENIDAALRGLSYFSHVDASTPAASLTFGFDSNQGREERRYLSDSADLILRYDFRTGGVEIGGFLGGAFDFTVQTDTGAYPLVGGYFNYYPIDRLRLTFDASVEFCHDPWYIPEVYFREGFDWMILHSESNYTLAFKEAFEIRSGFQHGKNAVAVSAALDGDVRLGWFHLYLSGGYLLTADDILFSNVRNFVEANVHTRFSLPYAASWFLDIGALSRVTVDGRGSVPLFASDGYMSSIIKSGLNYWRESRYHNTIISLSVGYSVPVTPTFGEFLIFKDIEAAIFCDVLVHDDKVGFSSGAEVQAAFSMIGLLEIPLRIRMGYDSIANGFISSYLIALKY